MYGTLSDMLEGKEPVLIADYMVVVTRTWGSVKKNTSSIHVEGKWVSELKGRTLKTGKITILE